MMFRTPPGAADRGTFASLGDDNLKAENDRSRRETNEQQFDDSGN